MRDPRSTLWALLGLWLGIELLYSSHWWPSQSRLVETSGQVRSANQNLRGWLERQYHLRGTPLRVWFAPYTSFPEPGYVESSVRSGVYDTFLAIPPTGLVSNYGASKLTPADTLFSLASSYGLAAELNLASRLGYGFFALDLGAVHDPQRAIQICRTTPGCHLSGDAYALFPIRPQAPELPQKLAAISRRMPQFALQSGGPRWGPIVLAPLQWGPSSLNGDPSLGQDPWLVVQALPLRRFELYRYNLDRFPRVVQPWLRLQPSDVQLLLAPDVQAVQLCIGLRRGPCRLVTLGPGVRRLAIGDLLPAGAVSRFEIVAISRSQPGRSPFSLALHVPGAAQALLSNALQR